MRPKNFVVSLALFFLTTGSAAFAGDGKYSTPLESGRNWNPIDFYVWLGELPNDRKSQIVQNPWVWRERIGPNWNNPKAIPYLHAEAKSFFLKLDKKLADLTHWSALERATFFAEMLWTSHFSLPNPDSTWASGRKEYWLMQGIAESFDEFLKENEKVIENEIRAGASPKLLRSSLDSLMWGMHQEWGGKELRAVLDASDDFVAKLSCRAVVQQPLSGS